ncbi:hypothetical protein Pan258_58740 [Symmachiella dynata]|nr:hypothetical protein Pan258_58740 [Symmachiella dynata]
MFKTGWPPTCQSRYLSMRYPRGNGAKNLCRSWRLCANRAGARMQSGVSLTCRRNIAVTKNYSVVSNCIAWLSRAARRSSGGNCKCCNFSVASLKKM